MYASPPAALWRPGYEYLPRASFDHITWTLYGVRHNTYPLAATSLLAEEGATTRWITYHASFDSIESGYLALSRFAPLQAHILIGFTFRGAVPPLLFSPELRYKRNSQWDPKVLLFPPNPIPSCMVCGLEEDLLYLRTTVREEEVYLYPLKLTHQQLRAYFRALLLEVERTNHDAYPLPFHPLSHNCAMMALRPLERALAIRLPRRHPAWWATTRLPALLAHYNLISRAPTRTAHHLNPLVRSTAPHHPHWEKVCRRLLADLAGRYSPQKAPRRGAFCGEHGVRN